MLHEALGHGAVAEAFGCRLTGLRLFLFGGGYVTFGCTALSLGGTLAIDLGGIALELALGAALLALVRGRRGVAGLFATAIGLLFVLHGLFYLATGVHYGAGDGRTLHGLLGAGRTAFVAAASAVLVAASFVAGHRLGARIGVWVAAPRRGTRIAIVAAAALAAAAAHGVLQRAEQRWLADPVYAATFEPEHERRIAAELRRLEEQPHAPGEIAEERRRLEREHAPFPLTPVLGVAIALAALAGIVASSRRPPAAPPEPVPLAGAALACAASIALVLALDRWWPP
ncbi:MAG: hypothetical protein OZ948_00500 [Deltaproteobacteria bacterium]|nr:hypothetical protein [Deltaproteobacteria bacterium]